MTESNTITCGGVALCVLQEVNEGIDAAQRPATLGDSPDLGLCLAADSACVSAHGDDLLVLTNVRQVLQSTGQ
jgi:hypothetical protein